MVVLQMLLPTEPSPQLPYRIVVMLFFFFLASEETGIHVKTYLPLTAAKQK